MSITLSPAEIEKITGHRQARRQLAVLHERGYVRAWLKDSEVILERAHYEAVCDGRFEKNTRPVDTRRPALDMS